MKKREGRKLRREGGGEWKWRLRGEIRLFFQKLVRRGRDGRKRGKAGGRKGRIEEWMRVNIEKKQLLL